MTSGNRSSGNRSSGSRSLGNLLTDSMQGLQATFYKGARPVFNKDNLTALQDFYTVSQLDLDWGELSPGVDIPTDKFSAMFEGKLIADQTGTKDYTFYLNVGQDEAVRLSIGNQKLIDTWNAPKSGELKARVSLTGGEAKDIRLEYKEGSGDARLKLEWEANGLAREVVPTQNFVRHGYGAVDESDLLTIRVATRGSNDFEIIKNPTQADYGAISKHTFSSIQAAVDQAEALMNTGQGVKILIAPGEYRVSDYGDFGIVLGDSHAGRPDQFALNNQGRQAPLVIEGAGPGVKILGSQRWQDGWQQVGNGVYKHEWKENWGFEVPQNGRPPADPITHRREAVFVNGKRLDPVLFREGTYNPSSGRYAFGKKINLAQDLKPGQFTVDEAGDAIYMKLQPGATIKDKIEVAHAEQLFRAHESKSNLVLRNLEFAHAANRYARQYAFAAVEIGGAEWLKSLPRSQNIVIDNVRVHDNSGAGLRLRKSDNITVRDSTFEKNGASGIAAKHLNGILLKNVDAEYNNWRGDLGDYRGWFVAGMKTAHTENITADNFNASNNYAHGYWYDLNTKNTSFANSKADNNKGKGLFIEVSDGPHQVTDSSIRNNYESGVLINTSPHVFAQGNYIANNGRAMAGEIKGNGEIQVGARKDRESVSPELPDIVDNITLIDNIVENTSSSPHNELIEQYANFNSHEDLLRNQLVANHNVYWDKTGDAVFELRHNKKVGFSQLDEQGERWLDASNRTDFEAGSVFERPKTGKAKPAYSGSFQAALTQGEAVVLTPDQLAVSDPDTYAFDLKYTLTSAPKQGSLRLRGVALNQGDAISFADVKRGWVSYTHEARNQADDTLGLRASDGTSVLGARNLALTIGAKDSAKPVFTPPNIPSAPKSKPKLVKNSKSKPIAQPLSNSRALVAKLSLDEKSGKSVADSSRNGGDNAGTLAGDATSTRGVKKGAIAFDGRGDAIHLKNSQAINLGTHGERTISLWFRADNIAPKGSTKGSTQIIYEEGAKARGLNMYLEGDQLYVGGWNKAESGWKGTWLSTDKFSANQWNHVALVLDGGDRVTDGALRGYINGQKFAEGEGSQLWEHSGGIGLGSIHRGTRLHDGQAKGGHGLTGAIDEVMIFNDALSDRQIKSLAT